MSTTTNAQATPGTENDARYTELREQNNKLFAKIGELESVIKAKKDSDGADAGGAQKEEVNKLITDVSDVVDELAKIKSKHVKRMDEIESEMQEELQKHTKFTRNSTAAVLPGKVIVDRTLKNADVTGLSLNRDQLNSVVNAIKDYGMEVNHDEESGDFRKWVFMNRYAKADVTSLHTDAAGSAGVLQTPMYEETILPPAQEQVTLLDMLPITTAMSSRVYWRQEKLSVRQGSDGVTVQSLDFTGTGQGNALSVTDFQFEDMNEEMRTFGTVTDVAIQSFQDIPQLMGYINNQLRYEARIDLEDNLIRGTNKIGTTGDQARQTNSLTAASTAFDRGLISDLEINQADRIDVLRASKLQADNTYIPGTLFLMHRNDVAAMQLLKNTEGNYKFTSNINSPDMLRPWGVPIVESNKFTEGEFITIPHQHCEVCVRKAWESGMSEHHSDNWSELKVTIRIYGRYGFKIYRPASIVRGTFSEATTG